MSHGQELPESSEKLDCIVRRIPNYHCWMNDNISLSYFDHFSHIDSLLLQAMPGYTRCPFSCWSMKTYHNSFHQPLLLNLNDGIYIYIIRNSRPTQTHLYTFVCFIWGNGWYVYCDEARLQSHHWVGSSHYPTSWLQRSIFHFFLKFFMLGQHFFRLMQLFLQLFLSANSVPGTPILMIPCLVAHPT